MGKAKWKEDLLQIFFETTTAHATYFDWLTLTETADHTYEIFRPRNSCWDVNGKRFFGDGPLENLSGLGAKYKKTIRSREN